MPSVNFMVIFAIAWCVGVAYVTTLAAVMFRVQRLKNPAARLDIIALLSGPRAIEALRFLFSGRHRQIGDHQLTRLLLVCRTLFVIALPLYAYVFWQAWILTQAG